MWTADKEKKLKQLWSEGHSASQIAGILGDTTRNAVIGKARFRGIFDHTLICRISAKTNFWLH